MDKKTHNSVRQILMNEMGLTREVIREEMRSIISDTIKKAVGKIDLDEAMASALQASIRSRYSDNGELRRLVAEAACDAAEKFITKRVSFATAGADDT
jgi:hypothetical protein